MRVRWLGWAGVEIEAKDETLVIDPLQDAAAVFGPFGEAASEVIVPEVVAATPGRARVGLVTHLHRDHTDAAALRAALRPDGSVLGPPAGGGRGLEDLGLAQAQAELSAAGLPPEPMAPWSERQLGPFQIVALPAVDGAGDPQVSWLVQAGGRTVLHLGDTMLHGFWWRMRERFGPIDVVFAPVNGAVLDFPHRQPPSDQPAVLTAEQAAVAVSGLQARVAIPMHFGAYEFAPHYRPEPDAATRFIAAAEARGIAARTLQVGESTNVREIEAAVLTP